MCIYKPHLMNKRVFNSRGADEHQIRIESDYLHALLVQRPRYGLGLEGEAQVLVGLMGGG
jgi:hypothetical protein